MKCKHRARSVLAAMWRPATARHAAGPTRAPPLSAVGMSARAARVRGSLSLVFRVAAAALVWRRLVKAGRTHERGLQQRLQRLHVQQGTEQVDMCVVATLDAHFLILERGEKEKSSS